MSKACFVETPKDELGTLLKKLRPFQREGFDFATRSLKNNNGAGRILLADEMGLGKTVTSLAIMLAYKNEWPLLILCPASLRYTWPAEIEKFYPFLPHSSVYVVKGFDDCDFYSNSIKKSRIKIVVATYSLLQNRSAAARVLQQFNFKCIIADESHNLKERNSQRCKLAMPLLKNATRLLLLSGTPALARPVELWSQLHCIDADLYGTYTQFTKRYCNARRGRFGWDVSGLSNADELHQKLSSVMVRRLKNDVLKDLPPKQRSIIPVKIQNPKLAKECAEVISELNQARASIKSLDGDEAASAEFEARRLLMKAYQVSGVGKAEAVTSYILDWLKGSGTQKLLVFAHHAAVLDTIEAAASKYFKGIGHIRIDGKVSPIERASRVKKFQNKPQVRLGLLSVTAAGVGLTLTAASTVIFAELHWTPGVLAQAEDRTHRIGQVNSVNIIYCVCKEKDLSVDLSLWSMIGRKVNNLGRLIDGDKNASLNASNVDNSTSESQLASFFAENCPSDNSSQKLTTPVKGSIQSFFAKQKAKSTSKVEARNSIKSQNRTVVTPDEMGKSFGMQSSKPIVSKKIFPSAPSRLYSWSCHACTFMNENRSISSGCEMCGTRGQEDKSSISTAKKLVDLSNESTFTKSSNRGTSVSKANNISCAQIIDLSCDDRDSVDEITSESTLSSMDAEDTLVQFSVSQNSGRVALYDMDENSLHINFDIDEVITNSTSDKILEKQLKRVVSKQKSSEISSDEVDFNDAGVKQVVQSLESYFEAGDERQLSYEIKSFVKSFILLREVEKKAIKEYNKPIHHLGLHETLKNILLSTPPYSEVNRYTGGSKERAIENQSQGKMSESDKSVLDGKACCWCGGDLPKTSLEEGVESTYCSQACAEEGRLRRGGMFASTRIRQQLFCLERGKCQKCGIDANALFLRIHALQPAERLNALSNVNWYQPKGKRALDRLLQNPKEGDFWQADHIVPVAEGGGNCGLENFRTLCTPCHQNETQKLNHRLRLSNVKSTKGSRGEKSMDLRVLFASKGARKSVCRKRKHRPD